MKVMSTFTSQPHANLTVILEHSILSNDFFFFGLFCFKLKPPLRRSALLCMSRFEGVLIVADSIYSPFTLSGEARKHKHRCDRRLTLEGENKMM